MTKTVEAIYEKGVLRLMEPMLLEDGTRVAVIVMTKEQSFSNRSPAEILANIAAMPLEAGGKLFPEESMTKFSMARTLPDDLRGCGRLVCRSCPQRPGLRTGF